jgi:hypothetical protein
LFQIICKALDLVEKEQIAEDITNLTPTKSSTPVIPKKIGMGHIQEAMKTAASRSAPIATSSSPNTELSKKISSLSLQTRCAMVGILVCSKRGSNRLGVKDCFHVYEELLINTEGGILPPVSEGEFHDLITSLDGLVDIISPSTSSSRTSTPTSTPTKRPKLSPKKSSSFKALVIPEKELTILYPVDAIEAAIRNKQYVKEDEATINALLDYEVRRIGRIKSKNATKGEVLVGGISWLMNSNSDAADLIGRPGGRD